MESLVSYDFFKLSKCIFVCVFFLQNSHASKHQCSQILSAFLPSGHPIAMGKVAPGPPGVCSCHPPAHSVLPALSWTRPALQGSWHNYVSSCVHVPAVIPHPPHIRAILPAKGWPFHLSPETQIRLSARVQPLTTCMTLDQLLNASAPGTLSCKIELVYLINNHSPHTQ